MVLSMLPQELPLKNDFFWLSWKKTCALFEIVGSERPSRLTSPKFTVKVFHLRPTASAFISKCSSEVSQGLNRSDFNQTRATRHILL